MQIIVLTLGDVWLLQNRMMSPGFHLVRMGDAPFPSLHVVCLKSPVKTFFCKPPSPTAAGVMAVLIQTFRIFMSQCNSLGIAALF